MAVLILIVFQLTAARRRLALPPNNPLRCKPFQLTAARRRLEGAQGVQGLPGVFQLTAARRRLGRVSCSATASMGFNSQPPEGGWTICLVLEAPFKCFNSQPPEGGWAVEWIHSRVDLFQLTAARRRLGTPTVAMPDR